MEATRPRYYGLSRKLVVALDIGTTYSGAAYALLDPGEVPHIQSVTRQVFPPISDQVATVTDERQVPKHSESGVRKSPLRIVL